MKRAPLDDAAIDVRERVRHDERVRIDAADNRFHLANLEARDDTVQDVLLGVRQAAIASIDGDAALKGPGYFLPYRIAFARDDRHGGVLFDAVDDEIERLRRR